MTSMEAVRYLSKNLNVSKCVGGAATVSSEETFSEDYSNSSNEQGRPNTSSFRSGIEPQVRGNISMRTPLSQRPTGIKKQKEQEEICRERQRVSLAIEGVRSAIRDGNVYKTRIARVDMCFRMLCRMKMNNNEYKKRIESLYDEENPFHNM